MGRFRNWLLVLLWLASFVLVPFILDALRSTTDVSIVQTSYAIYAEVRGTRLDLPSDNIPPELRKVRWQMVPQMPDAASSSLYWQPAQPGALNFLGEAGEWLQSLRPGAEWSKPQRDDDPQSGKTVFRASLTGGRTTASVNLTLDGKSYYAFTIRPERRGMAWWQLDTGHPPEQVASTIYRPSGQASLRDTASELVLIGTTASALALVAWLISLTFVRPRSLVQSLADDGVHESAVARAAMHPFFLPIMLFILATAIASTACLLVLDGIPHVQDDVAYIFQGKIFALGRSWVPTPPAPEFFANGFIEMYQGRWFSKYPPGYPLLLVPGLWAGMPWLINALSAGVSLALIYAAGRRMFGPHVAVWAGLLGLLSPWVIFMSGSYMSHPTTMMWVAVFLYALVLMRSRSDDGVPENGLSRFGVYGLPVLAGFAIGMAFITREWTALGIGIGAAVWALGDLALTPGKARLRSFRSYLLVLVGFVPPLIFLLFENKQLTGAWLTFAQDLVGSYDRPGFGPGHGDAQGHTPALGVYNTLVYLRTLATTFDGWPAPLALAPIILGLFAWVGDQLSISPQQSQSKIRVPPGRPKSKIAWDALLWLGALGLVGAYFLWWSSTTIFGPRYWYEAMPFLLLMAGRGLDLLGRIALGFGRASTGVLRWGVPGIILAVLTSYSLSQSLPYQVSVYKDYNGITASALHNVTQFNLRNALVFVALDPAKPNRDYGKVFFANDPLLSGPVVYARDLGAEKNKELAAQFPDRGVYWLPLDGRLQAGFGPSLK